MTRKPNLPYLMAKAKGGRTYWYFRRGAPPWTRLPDPSDPGFLAAYDDCKSGKRVTGISRKSTISALISSYKRSTRWEKLAPRTHRDYDKVLAHIVSMAGAHDVSVITRPAVIEARDANRHRARFANYIVQVYSILCEHAVDIGWMPRNPVSGTTLLALGDGWAPWPQGAIDAYRKAATGPALLIFELCLGTGQRISDVLKMRWSDIEDGCIKVKQGKTGNELYIPITPRLGGVLDAAARRGMCIVAGDDSRPLSYRRAAFVVGHARSQSGTEGYTIHGLRHSTGAELAEAGCTDAQIGAVLGHKTLRMVAKYRSKASQKRLAAEAMRLRSSIGEAMAKRDE